MRHVMLITAGLFGLAACSKEGEVDMSNASVAEVANEVAAASGDKANFVRAGQWSSQMTVEELSAPGMPPEILARMKEGMGEGRSFESCLTEEEANNPKADFFAGGNSQCRYDHFKMGDGKIDAKMRCTQGGVNQLMEMAGTYSPESYNMSVSTSMEGAQTTGGMTMRMRIQAKRVGECTGTNA